jgi:hypothetical protein
MAFSIEFVSRAARVFVKLPPEQRRLRLTVAAIGHRREVSRRL